MTQRFNKISAAGVVLDAEAAEWAAVEDTQTGLIWDAGESKPMTFKKALAYPSTLSTAGFSDWRLPTVEELFCLADRTKFNPAIDTAFFPKCEGSWYWSSTVDASSPGSFAWCVDFGSGDSYWANQGARGLVRAVRPRQ